MQRWNGGGKGLKYKDEDIDIATTGGGRSQRYPFIFYQDGTKQTRKEGPFYYIKPFDCFVEVSEWDRFYPDVEELDEYYISSYSNEEYIAIENKTDVTPTLKDFIYKVDSNSNKLKIYTNGDLDNFDSITSLSIITTLSNIPLITLEKETINNQDCFIFLVDISVDRNEFRYKTDIKTKGDFNKALQSTIDALSQFSEFNEYIEDLSTYIN